MMKNRKRTSCEDLNISNIKKTKNVLGEVNQNIEATHITNNNRKTKYQENQEDEIDNDNLNGSGVIEKVFVRNFMCHKSLEINLNKNINFVIGRNGSGKSAILTALVVGLGGRAADTNRGKSIKNFIRTGQSIASIEIVISNIGFNAYNPTSYGDRISVERILTPRSSSYKIKSAAGRIISHSAKEVAKICDALNVQVDNPICVLNQDTSRNFLNSSDPKRKYSLFMRATNLENINDYYKIISKDRQEIEEKLQDKKKTFEELKIQMKNWENKLALIESLDSLQTELEDLERELFWSKNKTLNAELDEIQSKIEKLNEQFEKEKDNAKNFNENDQHVSDNINNINQQLEEIKEELKKVESKSDDIRKKNRILEDSYNKKQISLRDKQYAVEKKTHSYNSFDNQVKQVTERFESITEKRAEQKREIDGIVEQLNELQAQLTTAEVELDHRRGSIRNVKDVEMKIMDEIKELNNSCAQKQAQIKHLSNQTNTLSLYGPNMAACVQEIEKNKHKFSEFPRGPLGRYIKLKDKKWTAAVELFIKHGMLKVFCVTNSQDYKILDGILSKYFQRGQKPLIICSKFFHKVFDVSRKRVQCPAGYYSLQDVLEISDPIVENCLIDQIRMETVLLTPNDDDAIRLMSHAENVPPNCTKSITLKGDLYYPDPDYRSYATKFKPPTLLQSSTAEVIRQFQKDIQEIEQSKVELENKIRINRQKVSSQQLSLKEHETHVTNLRQTKIKLQNQKRQLEYQMDPEDKNIDTWMNELQNIKKELEEAERQESQCKIDCENLKKDIDENRASLKSVQVTIDSLRSRMEPLQMQKMTEEAKRAEFNANCDTFKKKLNDFKKEIQQQKSLEKEVKSRIKDHLNSKQGKEIPNPRSEREIEQLKKGIQTSIRSINSQSDDPEYVREMSIKCREKYDRSKNMMYKLLENLDLINISIERRLQDYRKLIRRIGNTVEKMFHNVLRLRQYKGHLEINHEKRELEIHVQTQNNTTNNGDTRTLSGGERSYATVAFIMALWRSVKFPFYFMDEFDVFMDKINRKIIMDLLLQHAEENLDCQFVFLTPQDISSVKAKPHLTIHRMADPEREGN